jgi:hypothetical protein
MKFDLGKDPLMIAPENGHLDLPVLRVQFKQWTFLLFAIQKLTSPESGGRSTSVLPIFPSYLCMGASS